MILPTIKHTSPSFIMAYQMDEKICDKIIELPLNTRFQILTPIITLRKWEYSDLL